MENEEINIEKKPNVKMIVISSLILFVGIILLWPAKKEKPKLPVIRPIIKPPTKVIKKTITITPTEKTEIEEEEEEEIETPIDEVENVNE
jgi:hypothetical protein